MLYRSVYSMTGELNLQQDRCENLEYDISVFPISDSTDIAQHEIVEKFFNIVTLIRNLMKIRQLVRKILGVAHWKTDARA